MRWAAAKHGDFRVKRCFAYFPVQIERESVWLENFYIREELVGDWTGNWWSTRSVALLEEDLEIIKK